MIKYRFLIGIMLLTTVLGCNDKQIDYKLVIVSNTNLSQSKDDPLPSILREALKPYECDDSNFVFVPELSIYRTDLKDTKEYELEVPTTPENKLRKKLGSYSYVDLKTDHAENLPTMKAGEFLSKKSSGESTNVFKYDKQNSLVLFIDKNLKDFSQLKIKLDSILCLQDENFSKKIIVFLNNSNEVLEGPIESPEGDNTKTDIDSAISTSSSDPCAVTTVTDGLDLKESLIKIVDTKRSYSDRDRLARETWDKYFDPMASIIMYLNPTDKYPDMWESGDGENYLVDRLAYKSSITDINIIRIEYHKDSGKISSITTVECHNASEVQ